MKIKKRTTPAVVDAKPNNANPSTGLQSEKGKEASEANAALHDLTSGKGKNTVTHAVAAANSTNSKQPTDFKKIDKTVAGKVIAPNQKKTRKPSGPKTGAGEGRAALNGLFSKELQITEEDRPEFEGLRDSLSRKHAPTTFLRQIVVDLILCCTWRHKLELRKQETLQKDPQVEAAGGDTILTEQWYGADHRARQDALRFLRKLRPEAASGHLEQEGPWKASLIKIFGSNFYDCLTEWEGTSPWAIRQAEHLEYMLENYKLEPLPASFLGQCCEHWAATSDTPGLKPPPTDPRPGGPEILEPPQGIPDPKWKWQMQVKLIDLAIGHLEAIDKIMRKQGSREAPQTRAEFSPRHLADTSRDLQEAIKLLLKVEEQGL